MDLHKDTYSKRGSKGRPKRRFMGAVKGDMKLAGVREEDAEERLEADDSLWRPQRK